MENIQLELKDFWTEKPPYDEVVLFFFNTDAWHAGSLSKTDSSGDLVLAYHRWEGETKIIVKQKSIPILYWAFVPQLPSSVITIQSTTTNTMSLESIKQEFETLKGQFVITNSWQIERLIAISSDDMDYYWVTYNGRNLTFNTCVGGVIRLKGKIYQKDYEGLVRVAKLNHYDQETLWGKDLGEPRRVEIQHHKAKLIGIEAPNEFLTEVCWDIN